MGGMFLNNHKLSALRAWRGWGVISSLLVYHCPGNFYCRGWLSTIDLQLKTGSFV